MRRLAVMVLAGMLPGAAMAQEALIRLEAKRSPEAAAEAAAGWARRFDDVVTLPLPGGWTGIAIGPLERDAALERLSELKGQGLVPGDSFVSVPPAGTPLARLGAAPEPAADGDQAEPAADAAPADPVQSGTYLRLEAHEAEPEARAALERLRAEFPGAGLWQLPDGWFAVTLGPVEDAAARAWLPILTEAQQVPADTLIADSADLGRMVEEGEAPDLPAPGDTRPLPPLDEAQRALRWAGHYQGDIDGKDGPMTRAAIQAEIAGSRASTDPGTALQALIERREAWRAEIGLERLEDEATGLSLVAPMQALDFDRAERALSIYGPQDGSGAALILFSQPGGQQELLDLAGLVTALGWVPRPEREVRRGHVRLQGSNADHLGSAEGWVRDGRAEGYVLIWPASDAETRTRILAEISDSLSRHAPGRNEGRDEARPDSVLPAGDAAAMPETTEATAEAAP
ncbi:peptidoglycan-binding domain-containing protein [Paracoccus sp. T5]|uniref:peptidoglycan-binding domain-containing protein n=1 Tax=Paracoccus sp. T5 TaxID=3402161 RepID=UPI003AE15369